LCRFLIIQSQSHPYDTSYTQFQGLADDILEVSDNNVQRIFNMLHSLSLLTTSFLISEHKVKPDLGKGFVTIPDVEEHFGTARQNSGALVIAYMPEVSPSELEAWNQYSKEKQEWIQASLGSVNVTDFILPNIWAVPSEEGTRELESTCSALGSRGQSDEAKANRIPVEPDTGPFSPLWTFSPPPLADDVSIVNYNLRVRPALQEAIDYIAATKQPIFLDVCDHSASLNNQAHPENLQTVVVFPVFAQYNEEASDVVGHLVAVFPLEVFFQDILLDDSPPLRAVVENTCNQVFTFEIMGPDATLLSEEDLHDKTFTDMAIMSSFASIHEDAEDHDHSRRSQEIDSRTCQYTLTIYPTKAMHHDNITKNPVIFAMVVVGVFFLTSLLFVIFDCYVRKRTEKIMNVALKQNAIVSSLFPKNVQIKMMAEADQNDKLGKVGRAGIKSFLNSDKQSEMDDKGALGSSKPIAGKYEWKLGRSMVRPQRSLPHFLAFSYASPPNTAPPCFPRKDLFPATTIMFADMAGFTAWSSAREPSQVFTLLESIYSEFDRIAHRRKVFKVEVIGDCYVVRGPE
jgi:Adenylate and Guanylate cyclase catalytic domain